TAVQGFAGLCLTTRPRRQQSYDSNGWGYERVRWAGCGASYLSTNGTWEDAHMALTKRTKRTLYVVGIVFVAGTSLSAIPLSSSPKTSLRLNAPATGAKTDFGPLLTGASVPTNVISAVLVPSGSKLLARINYDGNQGSFDRSIEIASTLSRTNEQAFFTGALEKEGWSILENKVSSRQTQMIARIAGSDGNYWEVGIEFPFVPTKSQESLAVTTGVPPRGSYSIELRLLQLEPAS
ncbi:MAG: hypothetical protein ACP5PJ_02665, partial [Acidimicrobiales bacterium]